MAKFDNGSRKGKDFAKRHVPVESSMMGYIIGKGGQMIKTIESETGSRISSVKDGFMVKGTEEQCAKALRKINDILTSVQSRRRRSHMGSCSETNPPRQVDGMDNIFGPHPKMTKMISFLTSLEDEDEVKFIKYEGQTPEVWSSSKNPKMYCLEAVKKDEIESQCDSLERMKNYPMLENAVKENLTRILKKEEPVPVQLEIRFGKILWLGDSKNAPSDEIISETHFVKDLEKDGSVSVEGFLGRRTQWSFVTEVEDSERMPSSYLPVIGELEIIDLNFEDVQDYTQKIRVRIQCLRNPEDSKPAYKLLKVGLRLRKDLAYDCLHLDGFMDLRVVFSHCDYHEGEDGVHDEWARKVVESLTFNEENNVISFRGQPPNLQLKLIRHGHRKLYLIPHNEHPFILAHHNLSEYDNYSKASQEPYVLDDFHEEFELWNVQWMADFALLEGRDWREVFASYNCDISQFKLQPKKIEMRAFLEELQMYISLALKI